MMIWISVIYFFSFIHSLSDITHPILPAYVLVNSKGTYPRYGPSKKKFVKSPPMWASYAIKCPTVRAQKNYCQIPLSLGCPLC